MLHVLHPMHQKSAQTAAEDTTKTVTSPQLDLTFGKKKQMYPLFFCQLKIFSSVSWILLMSAMKLDYELNSKLVCLGLIFHLYFYSLIKVGISKKMPI